MYQFVLGKCGSLIKHALTAKCSTRQAVTEHGYVCEDKTYLSLRRVQGQVQFSICIFIGVRLHSYLKHDISAWICFIAPYS